MFKLKLSILSAAIAFIGCNKNNQNAEVNSVVNLDELRPELGKAYSEYEGNFLNTTCIDTSALEASDYIISQPILGDLQVFLDISREKSMDILQADAAAKIDMESLSLSGTLKIANESNSSEYASTLTLISKSTAGVIAIDESVISGASTSGKIKLTSQGRHLLTSNSSKSEKAKACGTGYLDSLKLSAYLVATLRIEFSNKADKDAFAGTLKLATEAISADGDVSVLKEITKSKGKFSLTVHQGGGDATKLQTAISDDMIKCANQNIDGCIGSMKQVLNYLKTDFSNQLQIDPLKPRESARKFSYTNATFKPYTSIAHDWDGMIPTPEILLSLQSARRTLNSQFMRELEDINRIQTILNSGMVGDIATRNHLSEIGSKIQKRIDLIAKAIAPCYRIEESFTPCDESINGGNGKLSVYEKLDEIAIDYSALSISPNYFMEYCAQASLWHTTYFGLGEPGTPNHVPGNANAAELDMRSGSRETLQALLNIPEMKAYSQNRTFQLGVNEPLQGIWSPSRKDTTTKNSLGQAIWNCPSIGSVMDRLTGSIDLNGKQLTDINGLGTLKDLNKLIISNNIIRYGIPALGKMEYLETLEASSAFRSSLKGLTSPRLRYLNLSKNDIVASEMENISNLLRLRELNLSENIGLDSIMGLRNLPQLRKLDVRGTALTAEEVKNFLKSGIKKLKSKPTIIIDDQICEGVLSENIPNKELVVCE